MGIGGVRASCVARIAKAYGFTVSGCDLAEGEITKQLRREGIEVFIGHDPGHLRRADYLVHTPAVFSHRESHRAVKEGKAFTQGQFSGRFLAKGKFVVAVAGTHGRATTAAILGYILERGGLDPTCEISAPLLNWDSKNYRVGGGKFFVCDVDESANIFLAYKPGLIVITSVDHPDFIANSDEVYGSFVRFVLQQKEPKLLVVNRQDSGCRVVVKRLKKEGFRGKVFWYDKLSSSVRLKVAGEHVRGNAAAAWLAAVRLGVDEKEIEKAVEEFVGVKRRFEFRGGTKDGVLVYDDWAAHPKAVRATIKTAKKVFPKTKIWVVFQPHMYSQLRAFFGDFVRELKFADRVIVTDVYSEREDGQTVPSGKDLSLAIGSPRATYVGGGLENVANFVDRNASKGNVVLVLGVGDVNKVSDLLVK